MFTMAYVHMAIEISCVYRHFDATDQMEGRVYNQKTYVNTAGRVVSSTKLAIYTDARVYRSVYFMPACRDGRWDGVGCHGGRH